MRGSSSRAALAASVLACNPPSGFICVSDSQCGSDGLCVDAGLCAFPDLDCDSGLRYGEHAGPLSGACVPDDAGSTAAPGTTTAAGVSTGGSGPTGPTASGPGTATAGAETGSPVCPRGWWDSAWTARTRFEVGDVGSSFADFPVLVTLDSDTVDWALLDPGGADLVFIDERGVPLPFEIDVLAVGSLGLAWVGLPSVQSGTSFWLYFGSNEVAPRQQPSAVWAAYLGVWHLSATLIDSAGGEACLDVGVDFEPTELGNGVRPQTGGFVECASSTGVDRLFEQGGTVEAFIRGESGGEGGSGRIVNKASDPTPQGWTFALNDGDRFHFARGWTDLGLWRSDPNAIAVEYGQPTHLAVVYDDTSVDNDPLMYIDGVEVPSFEDFTPLGSPQADENFPIEIGNVGATGNRTFDGVIDEVRISAEPLSEAWLEAQSRSMHATLLSHDEVERCGTP